MIIKQAEWKMIRSDRSSGGIEIHTSMDLITWTETFYIDLIRKGDDSTRVIMGRIGLGQPLDWGIARQFVEQFLTKLDSTLKNEESSPPAVGESSIHIR